LAVVAYDPRLIGATPVRSARLAIRDGGTLRSLEAELSAVSLSGALKLGLNERRLQQAELHASAHAQAGPTLLADL